MNLPKTKIVHSQSKNAWNIVGTSLGAKYKIARVPYLTAENDEVFTKREKKEAREHAIFISACFNNSEKILKII